MKAWEGCDQFAHTYTIACHLSAAAAAPNEDFIVTKATKTPAPKPNGVLATQLLPYVKIMRYRTKSAVVDNLHSVPISFVEHRRRFRVVGKRLMRGAGGSFSSLGADNLTGAALRALKVGDNETLAKALKKVGDRGVYVEATADEYRKYSAAESRLRAKVFRMKLAFARAVVESNDAAIAKLAKRSAALRDKRPGYDKRVSELEDIGIKAGIITEL